MGEGGRRTSRPTSAFLFGLAATACIVAVHLSGLDERVELAMLDFRFRHFSSAPPNRDLLHVDIDDGSLSRMGRWPWPRQQFAGLIEVLHAAGARAVALDVILPEPQETRFVSDAWRLYTADEGALLGGAGPVPVLDDAALADAMRSAGNVLLPMHVDFAEPREPAEQRRLDRLLADRPNLSARGAREALSSTSAASQPAPPEIDEEAFAKAYLRARSLAELRRFGFSAAQVGDYPLRRGAVVPPLIGFLRQAKASGFVTIVPDVDGVVRRAPLLAGHGDRAYLQFALTIVADELARRSGRNVTVAADARGLTLHTGDGAGRFVPADARGRLLVNWMRPAGPQGPPRHIPAWQVGSIWDARQKLARNHARRRLLQLELARRLGHAELTGLLTDRSNEVFQARRRLEFQLQHALLFDPNGSGLLQLQCDQVRAQDRALEQKIDALAPELLDEFYLQGLPHDDPRRREVMHLRQELAEALPQAERQVRLAEAEGLARLCPLVRGKICLIGSTATGAADFVPTPLDARTPGVVIHANIVNTVLSGRFVREAGLAVNVLVILLAGAVVSILTGRLPVWAAAPAVAALAAGCAAGNVTLLFARWNYALALCSPLEAMGAAFAAVTAYRQLTEERAKRQIRALFAHALSPALVDRLLEDPSIARLGGERREVTCFFSDLAGFTPLSERLGEQRTVQLLNRYFDRMTDVIQNRQGGYLNKFLGDGLLVFFGAPVVQEDRAARAVRAALECQEEIRRLNQTWAGDFDLPVSLSVRIGLATGEVMVGNCGSTERMDYTAIGDTVNVASRLESANKSFGTRVLVCGETWRQSAPDGLLVRPLGRVLVVGKTEPVEVWDLAGPADQAPAHVRAAYADFARAVELFLARQFAEAAETFEAVGRALPDDKAARLYASLCRQYAYEPPPPDWNGAIQLEQK